MPMMNAAYIDKPMRGHGLMQATPRNRVFRDKPGGLIVDYIGIAQGGAAIRSRTAVTGTMKRPPSLQ